MAQFTDYPKTIKTKSPRGGYEWTMLSGYRAKLHARTDRQFENEVMRIDPTTAIVQERVQDKSNETDDNDVPVYRLGENGPLGVPTGLIFVRVASGSKLEDYREQIEQYGYEIKKKSARCRTADGFSTSHFRVKYP